VTQTVLKAKHYFACFKAILFSFNI